MSKIKYPELAPQGAKKIEWVRDYMPVLRALEETYRETKPFAGMRVAVCVHLEAKTAYLCQVLRAAGAEVSVTGCNPLSTKDEIAAALYAEDFDVCGWFDATMDEYHEHRSTEKT